MSGSGFFKNWRFFTPAHDNAVFPEASLPDYARIRLVGDQLSRILLGTLQSNKAKTTRLCIGLLGGLGQGKTSTLHAVQHELKQSNLRCEWFDISHFKPDQLEFEFDRLQSSFRYGRVVWLWLLRGATRFALLLSIFVIVGLAISLGVWLQLPLVVDTVAMLPTQLEADSLPRLSKYSLFLLGICFSYGLIKESKSAYERSRERTFLLAAPDPPRDTLYARCWRLLCAPFCRLDVLFVDNLDRATKKQQRALLRSLYKYKGNLPYCVVIAFDEAGVLASDADPEPPRELMLKAIQVVVRIPDRQPIELLVLARLACEAQEESLHPLLSQPSVLSGLAGLLQFCETASPRSAKRLLNDGLTRLAQNHGHRQFATATLAEAQTDRFSTVDLPDAEQLLAVLRITVLLEIAPSLRAAPQLLNELLNPGNVLSLDKLRQYLPDLTSVVAVSGFLSASRVCRPRNEDWRDIVSISLPLNSGSTVDRVQSDRSSFALRASVGSGNLYAILDRIWNAIDRLSQSGDEGDLFPNAVLPNDPTSPERLSEDLPWLLPVLTCYLRAQVDGEQRWRLLEWFRYALQTERRWFDGDDVRETKFWIAELAFAQIDVHLNMVTEADISSWLEFGATDPVRRARLLLLYQPGKLCFHQTLRLLGLKSGDKTTFPMALALRPWLSALSPRENLEITSGNSVSTALPSSLERTANTMVQACWPSLLGETPASLIQQLGDQIDVFVELHRREPNLTATRAMSESVFHNQSLLRAIRADTRYCGRYWAAIQKLFTAEVGVCSYQHWEINAARDIIWNALRPPPLDQLSLSLHAWQAPYAAVLTVIAALRGTDQLKTIWVKHDMARHYGGDEAYMRLLYLCIYEHVKRLGAGRTTVNSPWIAYLDTDENRGVLHAVFGNVIRSPQTFPKLSGEPLFALLLDADG